MRVTEAQTRRTVITQISQHKMDLDKYSDQVTTGLKVTEPGDSNQSGTISRYRESKNRNEAHIQRIATVTSMLEYQDNIVSSLNDYVIRAQEIATQAANETYDEKTRASLSAEVYAIRDSVVALANSKYLGVYIYGGADDDDPPYDKESDLTPTTGTQTDDRYVFDNGVGTDISKNVVVTDTLTVQVSTPGNKIFGRLLGGLEKLARALDGYSTNLGDAGETLPGGEAYDFDTDYTAAYEQQSQDIRDCIDIFKKAAQEDISPEQSSLAGRLSRLKISESILQMTNDSTDEALANLQEVDIYEAATNLSNAQTALQASYLVTSKLLSMTLLDYI